MTSIYNTTRWRRTSARAIARDGHRCTVARLLGGECSPGLDAHHIIPVREGGHPYDLDNVGTACDTHHPQWENLRRALVGRRQRKPDLPRCPHQHRSREARRLCEARMARQRGMVAA